MSEGPVGDGMPTPETAGGRAGARLQTDVSAMIELSSRMSAAAADLGRLVDEVSAVLGEADAAIGVDDGARAFRRRFSQLAADVASSVGDARTATSHHQALIARGVREIGGTDRDLGLRLDSGAR